MTQPAFPGPNVATSATGRALAQGPPGPPGLQGLRGLKGDTGASGTSVPTTPAGTQSSSFTITSPSANMVIPVDTTAGPITCTIAGTPTPGVTIKFIDATQKWTTNAFTFATQASAQARNPASLASSDASTVVLNQLAGGSVAWTWCLGVGAGTGTWLT